MQKVKVVLSFEDKRLKMKTLFDDDLSNTLYELLEDIEKDLFDTDFPYDCKYVKEGFVSAFDYVIHEKKENMDFTIDDESSRLVLSIYNLTEEDDILSFDIDVNKYCKFNSIHKKLLTEKNTLHFDIITMG